MKNNRLKRAAIVVVAVLGVTGAAVMVGLHFATKELKTRVEQALGAESEVAEIKVGLSSIELRGIRIRGPKGWPAEDALRAERIVITPDLAGLVSARLHVPKITVEQAYLSVLRTRDGRLRLLPSLLEKRGKATASDSGAPEVTIGSIELHDGTLEFFDATVRQPAHKIRLEQLQASVDDLHVPDLKGRTAIDLNGVVKGVQRNGKLSIKGWAELATKNSEITTRLQGVDLVALQPYLIKASETGVKRGSLDLDLKSTVRNNRLHAPGTVTLKGLELAPSEGAMGTFMGVPRSLVISALKNRDDQIRVQFALEGNINDPQFSLNESFSKRMAASVAETLGISIEGLTRGVGNAAQGFGNAVKKLFGN
jgi:uncharacterized protein YhdP